MLYYLDTNTWSKISKLLITDVDNYLYITRLLNTKKQIQVIYSKENVLESLRRSIEEHIKNDFRCYNEIAHNRLIDFNGKIKSVIPEDVKKEIEIDNTIAQALKPIFDDITASKEKNESSPTSNPFNGFNKIELNNIPHDKVIRILEERLKSTMPTTIPDIGDGVVFDYKLMTSTLNSIFKKNLERFSEIEGFEDKINKMALFISDFMTSIMKTSLIAVKDAYDSGKGNNPFALLQSVVPYQSYATAMITCLLGAMQYFPDKKTLLEKKGVNIDMNDIYHVNYASLSDVFVTDDSRLVKRTLAAKSETKIKVEIIGYNEFYNTVVSDN